MAHPSQQRQSRQEAGFLRFVAGTNIPQVTNPNPSDEQLQSLLLIRISHQLPSDPDRPSPSPPPSSHTSKYPSRQPTYSLTPSPSRLYPQAAHYPKQTSPLRSDSVGRVKSRPDTVHPNPNPNSNPSICPPATPNPTPSTPETDTKFVQAEGTLPLASIWGRQGGVEETGERFSLIWSQREQVWVAIYRLDLMVCELPISMTVRLILILFVIS
jgi:hypothetical protein